MENDLNKVTLRLITESDTELIVKWRNQTDVRKNFFFRETFTEEMHRKWLDEKVKTGQVVQFIIMLDNTPIGSTYLRDIDRKKGSAEYGVFIGESDARGQGVGSQVLKMTLDYAESILKLNTVYARVISDNLSSLNVFLHSGFIVIEKNIDAICSDGEHKEMIMLRKELAE